LAQASKAIHWLRLGLGGGKRCGTVSAMLPERLKLIHTRTNGRETLVAPFAANR
jgi:hypothetical protein